MTASAEVGAKGRLVIPAQVRQEAGIDVAQTLIATADGAGRIILETPEAVQSRVWAAAPDSSNEDSVTDVRSLRDADTELADSAARRRAAATRSSYADAIDESGRTLLQSGPNRTSASLSSRSATDAAVGLTCRTARLAVPYAPTRGG